MSKAGKHLCIECGKKRDCKPVVWREDGTVEWCCPKCYRENGYGAFLYEEEGSVLAKVAKGTRLITASR